MLTGECIVCVANTPWEGDYQKSTVLLLSRLARTNKVIYVEYAHTIKDVLDFLVRKQWDIAGRIIGWRPRLRSAGRDSGLCLYLLATPPVLSYGFARRVPRFFDLLVRWNAAAVRWAILRAIRQLGVREPIVINAFNPVYGLHLVGRLREKAAIYYCYDEISGDRYQTLGGEYERRFMARVAGVITTSPALWSGKKPFCRRCYLVKNGVDYALFAAASPPPRPPDLRRTICYIGSIDQRFDLDIVRWCVEQLPDYRFLIVGRNLNPAACEVLAACPNVEIRPPVRPEEVPGIIAQSQAGIIPYTRTEINKYVYPLKINEYLAVGIPVVITNFADLGEFASLVTVAGTREEFLDGLVREIDTDSDEKRAMRRQAAMGNSWEQRTEEFSRAIAEILAAKDRVES